MIWDWKDERELKQKIISAGVEFNQAYVVAHTKIPSGGGFGGVSVIPHDPEAYARALYAELHRCDEEKAALIVIEAVPKEAEWEGIADRLQRAAV